MKTSELTGAALDWAVAKCEGVTVLPKMRGGCYATLDRGDTVLLCYSTNWAQAGPIIEREGISVWETCGDVDPQPWSAIIGIRTWCDEGDDERDESFGPTPLIAAMRCYVASKLGEDVEIPKELT